MLKVKNLVKIYKIGKTKETVKALNNVSIDFPEKGLVFLLGKSGSGKSTLLNAIGGLDTFNSGEIIIKGKSSKDFSQADFDSYRNTFIGFIFQEYNVLEEFTVAKNLSIALELQGKTADKNAVNKLLEQVDMLNFAKRKPNQLSGGQKQRVAIARALIKNPEIIMADEPTGALDSNTGKQVMDTLKKLSQEKLVIIVSHDREFAEIYGDRIIELKDGKIIQDVTKKEIESQKTNSGVSIIDDKIIHIKKGIQLTNDDINKINTVLKTKTSESDIIISIDESANDQVKKANFITKEGNKEAFLKTEPEDVVQKQYDPKKFKLIKSQLKFKDSFKMGASALKNKVGKLVFTIMLSFIAFAMFGVIDTFSTFNRAGAIFHTVEQFNKKSISILKEEEGEYSNNVATFKEEDVRAIKEKFPDIELKKVVGANIRFGSSYWSDSYGKTIYIQNLNNSSSNPSQVPYISGMINVTDDEMNKLGLQLVAGRMPEEKQEIAISKHIFDAFKSLNSNADLTYEKILSTHKSCSLGYNYDNYTIVGIVDDGSDFTEYMNMETAQISSDYMLQQKISRELDFGFANMTYITAEKYDELLSKPTNMSLYVQYGDYDSSMGSYSFESNRIGNMITYYTEQNNDSLYSFENSYNFYHTSGSIVAGDKFITLANNEIILEDIIFNSLFDTDTKEERTSLLENATTPLTVELESYYYDDSIYDYVYTTEKTFTVVGHHSGSIDIFANEATIAEINNLLSGNVGFTSYRLKKGTDAYDTSLSEISTIENCYSNYGYGQTKEQFISSTISYYKNNGSLLDAQGNFIDLGENEIIINEDSLRNVGQGEELQEMIDNGLTINLSTDWEGKKIVATVTVVGLSNNWDSIFISQSALNGSFKDLLSGFDYSIAILTDNNRTNEDFIKYCESFNSAGFKYTVQTGATPILDQFGDILNSVSEVLLYVGIGFAVFAALLLMNFISTSISYKKREIGILRALGARGSDVFGIFFNESAVIAMINFALATIATFITCGILNNVIITKLGLDLVLLSAGIRQIALIFGVSLLTAFISSFLPVMKIAKKKPIDAINNR